jgi:hypothetical protein
MWRKVEEFFFGDRWKGDEYAWRVWQSVVRYQPAVGPSLWRRPGLVCGQVTRVYQRARHGTKALVDFGPVVGVQDTWWPGRTPPRGRFVFVEAHLWPGPDTHSGGPVIWIDRWDSTASGDVLRRARRHERRMAKLAAAEAKAAPET